MMFVAALLAVAAGDPVRLPAAPLPADHWESGDTVLLKGGAILALVLLNGFFVASELAIVSSGVLPRPSGISTNIVQQGA